MTTKKVAIEVDAYQDIFVEKQNNKLVPSLHQSIFLSDGDSPIIEVETSLDTLLQKFIDMNSTPSGYFTESQKEDLLSQMEAILEVVLRKKEHVETLEVFDLN